MFKSKIVIALVIGGVLTVGVALGSYISSGAVPFASADNDKNENQKVDEETLNQLYLAAFGRPVDSDGKKFHLNKGLKQVLKDINNSAERRYYSALFKSVKAYEEAVRAPGDLSAADKQKYLDAINTALSTLLAWVETLPQQKICNGIVGIMEARQAIQDAYDHMSPAAQAAAQKGIFNALKHIGGPKNLDLPLERCLATPTPTPTATPTPTPTPAPLSITTTSLPAGTASTSYSAQVSAAGGTASYVWSVSESTLPLNLTLTQATCVQSPCQVPATISGIPNTPGTYTFIISLTSGTEVRSRQFTLTIASPVAQ